MPIFLLHFPWSSLKKKKTKNFLTSLSLHWNPETFGSAFKNPLISIFLKKHKILFVQLRPICTYASIGNTTQKTKQHKQGGCTPSLSAHSQVSILAHFPSLPWGAHFLKVVFLCILKKIYYLLAEEKMTSEAKWKQTYPCLKRTVSDGQNSN